MEHFDVLIVGAGISGVGAAYHLQHEMPERSFVILETLESFGGTWLTHKYPGVRSDSDLYTFGYGFKPWVGPPIATAGEILKYMGEVIDENDLGAHIRYRHHISDASWDSGTNLWTLQAENLATGEQLTFTTNFLWMCQGYYQHDKGYTPEWPGMDRFKGQIVHPQTWPEDLDYAGKKVICIGSGATAATVVPAIAGDAAHVTVLQRSPTYFWTGPNRNETADMLRELDIPEEWVHEIVRKKILKDFGELTTFALTEPDMAREALMQGVRDCLPEGYDVEKHFGPKYKPWQQRLAFVPNADLFEGIKAGKASMVTDEIETFTETGIRTKGGEELEADIILTATGFNISVLGNIAFSVDGKPLDLADTITYRGMMFTGVPNMLWVFGYFRASWTLRADLISDLVIRLLRLMDAKGVQRVTPHLRPQDEGLPVLEWMAEDNFNPNYLKRSMHLLPKRLDVPEWMHTQDYYTERETLPAANLDDGCLVYE
ncbi:MAG: NAD(P)/FAD-dependent oxidoreductase [Actinomycetota bacterium]|nr:NAD(P)/FAD-dependent oxidoreductase [Actinomycetota bacterium]